MGPAMPCGGGMIRLGLAGVELVPEVAIVLGLGVFQALDDCRAAGLVSARWSC